MAGFAPEVAYSTLSCQVTFKPLRAPMRYQRGTAAPLPPLCTSISPVREAAMDGLNPLSYFMLVPHLIVLAATFTVPVLYQRGPTPVWALCTSITVLPGEPPAAACTRHRNVGQATVEGHLALNSVSS